MKKIVFTNGGGRFANQLTNLAHLIAFQQEYISSFYIMDLAIIPYLQYLEPNNSHLLNEGEIYKEYAILERIRFNKRIFNQYVRYLHIKGILYRNTQSLLKGESPNYLKYLTGINIAGQNLCDQSLINKLKSKEITYLAGWPLRDWLLFNKYESRIRELIKINNKYYEPAKQRINNLKRKYDLIIGVFVRQGDYKKWNNGKYYFEFISYIKYLLKIKELFPQQNIAFIIASETRQSIENYNYLNLFPSLGAPMGNRNFMESFSELSLCDYIVSPPSTYGIWASFMNQAPVFPIYEQDMQLDEKLLLYNMKNFLANTHFSRAIQ